MSSNRENTPNESGGQPRSSGAGRNPPLVIVSERGRHSEASRRIVRAQAARASAAQSRETRARNREDRQAREGPLSPSESSQPSNLQVQAQPNASYLSNHGQGQPQDLRQPQPPQPSNPVSYSNNQDQQTSARTDNEGRLKPLVNWITNILHLSARSFAAGAAALASTGRPQLGNASDVLSTAGGYIADSGLAMEAVQVTGGLFSRKLPIALPRGFAMLQTRIQISDGFLVLLSRTACFDYASLGVENRLNELLFDVVMTTATRNLATGQDMPEHPIQKHLRLACVCLTIFQGQRADGATFAHNSNYNLGLKAAWDEALDLDQNALKEPKSAEAALWAVFIISVTCDPSVDFFHRLLWNLLQDLQLFYWEKVRNVLLDFIYPGSLLDEPCKQFYQVLSSGQQMMVS